MGKIKKYRSDFLFPQPSFLQGIGSVFNISGIFFDYNYSSSDQEADSRAIASDWGVAGEDLKVAISKFQKEQNIPEAHVRWGIKQFKAGRFF